MPDISEASVSGASVSGATTSEASVATVHGSRYLQQLCKHWSHKLDVSLTDDHGIIRFPHDARGANWAGDGIVTLTVRPDALLARIEASEAAQLAALKVALASHLDRFAFREAPLAFNWRDGPQSPPAGV